MLEAECVIILIFLIFQIHAMKFWFQSDFILHAEKLFQSIQFQLFLMNWIIWAYDIIATTNFMSDSQQYISHNKLQQLIIIEWRCFQLLMQAAEKINNERDLADINKSNAESTEWFTVNQKLFNVHVKLHLFYFAKKYKILMNYNMLSEKLKHM